ncbi:MAG: YraN family protein [Bacteroidetes bacterium]|nr:YraN family protein [Bacteroidota bacterium]
MVRSNTTIGKFGEKLAVQYLEAQGYTILEQNYRFQHTEIDIVAREGSEIVFVEVKSRRNQKYGDPVDAMTEEKVERLQRAAEGYFHERNIDQCPCRFDFIGIEIDAKSARIHHLKNIV